MKSHKKTWIVLFVSMIVGGWSIASSAQNPTKTGDHCKDDAIAFMEKHFGDDLTFVHWEKDTRSGPPPQSEVVYVLQVKECSGSFVVTTGTSHFCGHSGHWDRGSHVRRAYATGDCKEFIADYISRHGER